MAIASFCDALCNGTGGRLALGSTVLVYVIVYNEASAPTVFFAVILATIYGIMAARCKTSLRTLQMPYIRASNKCDFTCLFLATWMDTLAILCGCAALTRSLSTCLDVMTGGLARILILGRNSPTNEPWPDVLGVTVVFLVTGMFMLGLEHSKAFSFVMTLGMFGMNALLSAVSWWNGDMQEWTHNLLLPNGISSLITATALLTFTFPCDYPISRQGMQRFIGPLLIAIAAISLFLAASCLSTIVHYKAVPDYIAVPLFTILEENNFHKFVPAAACLLMLCCSGALLELYPELYGIITRFATTEWKIFSRQISYESSDSGNPVLAVFISGSLCATLAFACPLQNLCYTLAASHLCAGFLRAFYLLYIPFRPKFMQPCTDSSLSYSRLSTAPVSLSGSTSSNNRHKRSLWNISLPKQSAKMKPKVKPKPKKELEKEWLLLGEPTSPCPTREPRDVESTILSDGEPPASDFEYPEKLDNSDSDTSTDIDAIVDEYRQKIKVTTAGPMDHTARVPTVVSWRVTIFAVLVVACGIALTIAGLVLDWIPAMLTGCIGVLIISFMMSLIPKYSGSVINVSPMVCCANVMLSAVLFAGCACYSWPAIIFWLLAGLILLMRCDNLFCSCIDYSGELDEQLIQSVSGKSSSCATTTMIRIPRPPKGIVTMPMRINSNR